MNLKDKRPEHSRTGHKANFILYSDVKSAALKFEEYINELSHTEDMKNKWLKYFREVFGDFNE